jgi:leucyl aminopeptidase
MKTSDLLLLAIGVGLGYYGFKKYQQNKSKKVVTPKTTESVEKTCEEQWNEKSKTMKISAEALNTAKVNFLLSCSPELIATV